MLSKGLPEKTLGWEILNWGSAMLAQPDGLRKGHAWRYSPEQAKFIIWFYALDERGRFLYRNAVLERPKGWGKSPLLAAICCTELLGPVYFDGWDADGNPVGRQAPTPLVQIAAISDSQANNTMDLVREMLAEGEARNEYYGLDIMLAKVTAPGGRKLEKVTASPRGREGNRATFSVMDETHLWVPAEKGPELYEAIARNLAKMNCRWVETTNAPVPGEGSVAEISHEAYDKMMAGESFDQGLLFDTREVYVEDIYDPETAIPALRRVYGDAGHPETGWINLDRIWAEINDPRTKEHVARRFYFNQRVSGHTTWLRPSEWLACRDSKLKLKKTDKIALGFKVRPRQGGAVLVACRLTDGALFNLSGKNWEKPEGSLVSWEVSTVAVDRRIRKVIEDYEVVKFLADPQSWQDIIGRWSIDFGKNNQDKPLVVEFWSNNRTKMSKAVEQFETAVTGQRISWNDEQISRHVLSCHTEEVPQGYVIRPETKYSNRYIIGAQAAVLALEAAVLAIEEGALKETDNYVFSF